MTKSFEISSKFKSKTENYFSPEVNYFDTFLASWRSGCKLSLAERKSELNKNKNNGKIVLAVISKLK